MGADGSTKERDAGSRVSFEVDRQRGNVSKAEVAIRVIAAMDRELATSSEARRGMGLEEVSS
jgi:hypothetical protein